jgi:hypothetical protein
MPRTSSLTYLPETSLPLEQTRPVPATKRVFELNHFSLDQLINDSLEM